MVLIVIIRSNTLISSGQRFETTDNSLYIPTGLLRIYLFLTFILRFLIMVLTYILLNTVYSIMTPMSRLIARFIYELIFNLKKDCIISIVALT
jgi:hypothetical protein